MDNMEKEIEKIKNGVHELVKRAEKTAEPAEGLLTVCEVINASWSGSDLVGHSDFYYGSFETPPHNRRFSIEWGLLRGVPDGWHERSGDEVLKKIDGDSGVSAEKLDKEADYIVDEFEKLRKQAIVAFSKISREAAVEVEKFHLQTKLNIFNCLTTIGC